MNTKSLASPVFASLSLLVVAISSSCSFKYATHDMANQPEAGTLSETVRKPADEDSWAGGYSKLNVIKLILHENGQFNTTWSGCLRVEEPQGDWDFWDGRLRLNFQDSEASRAKRNTLPEEFIGIRWSGRKYLVPESELGAFCSVIHQGWEPRHG